MRAAPAPDPSGVAYALAAYGLWGVAPVYWKALGALSAGELVGQRVLWSLGVAGLLLTWTRRWPDLGAAVRSRRSLAPILLAAALIGANWLTFIWAVNHQRVLATSLGYYVTPLVQVGLGALFLGERLSRPQTLAVGLAGAGVLQLALALGGLPWISLVLAFSFAFYGLVRKLAPVDPLPGFALELLLLAPVAAFYLAWLGRSGEGVFPAESAWLNGAVAASGVFTAAPLLCFHTAAKRLRLVSVGFFQYIAPSITLLLAVALWREPFGGPQAVAFGCVWAALALFSWEAARQLRRLPSVTAGPGRPADRH